MNVAPHTTQAEVDLIQSQYRNPDGTVNYDDIAGAIESWDENSAHDIEDLLTTYFLGRNELPSVMAQAGSLADPEAFSYLWSSEMQDTLEALVEGTADQQDDLDVAAFLALDPRSALNRGGELLGNAPRIGEVGSSGGVLNPYNSADFEKIKDAFKGDLPTLLLFKEFFQGIPQTNRGHDTLNDIEQDISTQIEETLDEFYDIEADSPTGSADTRALENKLQNLQRALQAIDEARKALNEMSNNKIQTISQMMSTDNRTISTVIGNMR